MVKYDLSILIPARNEMFISNTVEDILKNKRGHTEIIVGLDGDWAYPGIIDHPDVTIVKVSASLGQRGMTNQLARLSNAKYVAKTDAHCSFSEGFDLDLMNAMVGHDDWTVAPMMCNLHAFDWKCMKCGLRTYQGPTPGTPEAKFKECENCGNADVGEFRRKLVWKPRHRSPHSSAFCFDTTLHFQYHGDWKKKQEGNVVQSMSLQGSFFMMTRKKYWELNICDESHGSWGQQGVEVACKTWLSGGEVRIVRGCWYAHMFRTQGGDFGFPYVNDSVTKSREYSRDIWFNNKFEKQIYPLSWLIAKFGPLVYSGSEEKRYIHWDDPAGKAIRDQVIEAGNKFYAERGKA